MTTDDRLEKAIAEARDGSLRADKIAAQTEALFPGDEEMSALLDELRQLWRDTLARFEARRTE